MTRTTSPGASSLRDALGGIAPYLEGVRARWVLGLASAMAAGLVALAIPQVIHLLVDTVFTETVLARPSSPDSRADVWRAAGLLTVLGLAEAAFIGLRRYFILPPAAGVENRARIALFERLQRLPVAFHDAWPSGQLLSRAQGDLSLLRRWIAFGSVMLVVDVVTIAVGLVLLFLLSWQLALLYLAAAVPIMWASFGFRNDFRAASRLSQDQAGDLATSVEESVHGIRVLKDSPDVDIMLVDIMMPEMDGFTAMQEIRKEARFAKLPIIAVTAKAMKDDQDRCLRAGANDYLAKPIDLDRLFSLIRVWLPKVELL